MKTIPTIEVRELKAHLSAYFRQVKQGKVFVITEDGKPIAYLKPPRPQVKEKTRAVEKD